jgi:hypothetical protein
MKRIMIVGGPGSGKSTMARWVGEQTGLPVQHMDHIHWMPDWIERPRADRLEMIRLVEESERWIIGGGISERYAERLARADFLVWLDLPVSVRLWRDAAQLGHKGADIRCGPFHLCTFGSRGVMAQASAVTMRLLRPYGTVNKPATTIGADVEQNCLDAVCAERALITTDAGICAVWRQVAVTHLTVWS